MSVRHRLLRRDPGPRPPRRAVARRLHGAALAILALTLSAAPGCVVRLYQPLSGLHRPVVTDPRVPNFGDTRLDVHCVPGDLLNEQQAGALCQKVRALFENQGAEVRTFLSAGRAEGDDLLAEGQEEPAAEAGPRTELSLELRARKVHASNHPLSWALCVASFTLLPGTFESTFAQDVVVRDGSGFLLLNDTLEGRLVTRFGFGVWATNAIFDLWRPEEDEVLGDASNRELSADLYRQLTQLVFNAKMHAEVLEQGPAVGQARP
jgi:hypothetical protein